MAVVLTIIAVLLLIWWLLRFVPAGVEAHMPMPYSTALDRHLWVPAVIGAVWSAALGCWWGAALYAVLLVLVIAGESPYYRHLFGRTANTSRATANTATDGTDRPGASADGVIRAMTLNCRYGRADAENIVRLVRERHIDVLALEELTDELVERLSHAGLNALLPYCQQGA